MKASIENEKAVISVTAISKHKSRTRVVNNFFQGHPSKTLRQNFFLQGHHRRQNIRIEF